MKKQAIFVALILILEINLISTEVIASEPTFYKAQNDITLGMSGGVVRELQEYLATQAILPSQFVTGYFGSITQTAVKIFQL